MSSPFANLVARPELSLQGGAAGASAVEVLALRLPGNARAWHLRGLLDKTLAQRLRQFALEHCTLVVGTDGIAANYQAGAAVGSRRASTFDEPLAAHLWERLGTWGKRHARHLAGPMMHTDWVGHACWQAVAVNPLMRFIRYERGEGELVAHYDAPYVQSEACRTLMSLVLYLSDNEQGGCTRFLLDPQDSLPFAERDFSDQRSVGREEDVLQSIRPVAGDALLLEHRVLHDSSPLLDDWPKVVLRTDVLFERASAEPVHSSSNSSLNSSVRSAGQP